MLTKYDEGFLKQYGPQLQKPKWKFILLHGLPWALFVMVITSLLEYFVFNKGSFTIRRFFIGLAIWTLGGIFYGWLSRLVLMKRYKALQNKITETGS